MGVKNRRMKNWLMLPIKATKFIFNEVGALIVLLIVGWPSTSLGYRMRRAYWRSKTGVKNILVGRNSSISDCTQIVFGNNIAISSNVELVADGVDGYKVFIGSNILIARGTYLRSANHRFDDPDKPIVEQGYTSKKVNYNGKIYSIVIADGVWIGANVTILSGAMIGEGAIVGAGSIVTGAIPPYSIAAGCPARVISTRKKPVHFELKQNVL